MPVCDAHACAHPSCLLLLYTPPALGPGHLLTCSPRHASKQESTSSVRTCRRFVGRGSRMCRHILGRGIRSRPFRTRIPWTGACMDWSHTHIQPKTQYRLPSSLQSDTTWSGYKCYWPARELSPASSSSWTACPLQPSCWATTSPPMMIDRNGE